MKDCHNHEPELIHGLRHGDVAAFTAIYRLYFRRLYVYCLQFTKSANDAEDIVQEVFTKLWTNRDSISSDDSVRALLFVMARNSLISAYRKTINAPAYADYIDYCNTIGHEDVSRLEYEEFVAKVKLCIGTLPNAQRQVVSMSKLDQLTNKEIADKLGINEQSVKNHLSLGLKTVRAQLSKLITLLLLIFS